MSSTATKTATDISLSYKDSGVDIDAGNSLIDHIKPHAKSTIRDGVLSGLGGFGALFEIPLDRYSQPVLVSGTDGVGTKLKLAMQMNKHGSIGIDLVAMCVNDLIVQGAEPLFFLDYYASGQLNIANATDVIKGIAKGCVISGCALTGGETAEMPGMYQQGDYDLAGFCVGIVEKSKIIDGSKVESGNVLLGLASSGPHSNGYSLIRKVLEVSNTDLNEKLSNDPNDRTIGESLLEPTRIYVKTILSLLEKIQIHAISHITGGGLTENLPRVLPQGLKAIIEQSSWELPAVFKFLQQYGNIKQSEMLRTFNCGIGLVICVKQDDAAIAIEHLTKIGEQVYQIGKVSTAENKDLPSYVEFS